MAAGTTTVVQQGQPGVVEVTYRTTVTNGQNGERQEVSRKTITEATPTITKVGTKKAAAAAQPAPAAAAAAPAAQQSAAARSGSGTRTGGARRQQLQRVERQLGRHRQVRVEQQLVDQHRQRLLRRPAVRHRDLAEQRRRRVRAARRPGHQGPADRHCREGLRGPRAVSPGPAVTRPAEPARVTAGSRRPSALQGKAPIRIAGSGPLHVLPAPLPEPVRRQPSDNDPVTVDARFTKDGQCAPGHTFDRWQ